MTDLLVNSIYPLEYFSLDGVDRISYPDTSWWSSRQRFASVDSADQYLAASEGGAITSEVLEIDLGRERELNYLNFDILRVPLNIQIEYDAVSNPDFASSWVSVVPVGDQPFDSAIHYDSNTRAAWFNADFDFADVKGNIISTRYLRLTFTRRDERWPLTNSAPFQWPVLVKHLRVGRYVADIETAIGPLVGQDLISPSILEVERDLEQTRQVRQQFVYPADAKRGDSIMPRIMGFSVLANVEAPSTDDTQQSGFNPLTDVQLDWSIWDVTTIPVRLVQGSEVGAVRAGQSWIDIFLREADFIAGDLTHVYELRVSSPTPVFLHEFYTQPPNNLSSRLVPGTLTFHHGTTSVDTTADTTTAVRVGDYLIRNDEPEQIYIVNGVTSSHITINTPFTGTTEAGVIGSLVWPLVTWDDVALGYVEDAARNLICRVWGDVASEGRDLLGNKYRYGVRIQAAADVVDSSKAGWMSAPVPTPDAVEALYFDIRGTDGDGKRTYAQIDAIRIAPRTPGVRMNVYHSRQNLQGDAPQTVAEWDFLLWAPTSQVSYTLRRNEVIELPRSVDAAFIKLEFTALNPLPYNLPTFPPLPPKKYRRYPTWVEDQFNNAAVRQTVSDWFVRNATPVEVQVLQALADPVLEFEYKQKLFLASLALGQISDEATINSQLVSVQDQSFLDPTTASQIFLDDGSLYADDLLISIDQNSLLGQVVAQRGTVTINPTAQEAPFIPDLTDGIPVVSTINDRITESYQSIARIPMRFNQICRHQYVEEEASFNKKAYFVGVDTVEFLRADFTVQRDDPLIVEDLFNDDLLEFNSWESVASTSIPDQATIWVSYSVNPNVQDEAIQLDGFEMVALKNPGVAFDMLVYSLPGHRGTQFFQDVDYDLAYGTINGVRYTFIGRSPFKARLTAPHQDLHFRDVATVVGIGVIPSPATEDFAIVTGIGVPITTSEGPLEATYGISTYGAHGGHYGDLRGTPEDDAVVTGIGVPSTVEGEGIDRTDAGTVIGIGVVESDVLSDPRFVSESNAGDETGANTSARVARPANVQAGDILLAGLTYNDILGSGPTAPAGWVRLTSQSIGADLDYQGEVWYKVATASEPSTYTWAGRPYWNLAVACYRNAVVELPPNFSAHETVGASHTLETGTVTPGANHSLLIGVWLHQAALDQAVTATEEDNSTAMTVRVSQIQTHTSVAIADRVQSAAAPTAAHLSIAQTPSADDSTNSFGVLLTLPARTNESLTDSATVTGVGAVSGLDEYNSGADIAFVNTSVAYAASGASVTVNKPTGTLDGDVLLAHVFAETANTHYTDGITPPAGWTLLVSGPERHYAIGPPAGWSTSITDSFIAVYYKVASGEGSDYTFVGGSDAKMEVRMSAWRDVDNITPIDSYSDYGFITTGFSGGYDAPSTTLTPSANRCMVVGLIRAQNSRPLNAWNQGFTMLYGTDSLDSSDLSGGDLLQAAATAVNPTFHSTNNFSSYNVFHHYLVALKHA